MQAHRTFLAGVLCCDDEWRVSWELELEERDALSHRGGDTGFAYARYKAARPLRLVSPKNALR
jgi:hypothetical protein